MSSKHVLDIKKPARRVETRRSSSTHAEPRTLRLKTRRLRARVFAFCICLLGTAGLAGGIAGASHLERFAITDISIQGAVVLPQKMLQEEVRTAIHNDRFSLFSRANMFLYPRAMIQGKLHADFPRIQSVSITRESLLAQAIVVTVQERAPFARWCKDEHCYFMDATGYIFAEVADSLDVPKSAYVFRGGLIANTEVIGQTFLRGRFNNMLAFLDSLVKANFAPQGLHVDSEKDFTVPLEKFAIRASFDTSFADIIHNLDIALTADTLREKITTLEYIDLRFGNRVYYK